MSESKTLIQRVADDFRAGTAPGKFMAEVKELTDDDKKWFVDQYNREGLPTVMSKEELPS